MNTEREIENPTMSALNQLIPAVTDLQRKACGDVEALNHDNERIFAQRMSGMNGLDLRYALDYLAGFEQKRWQQNAALKFIEKIRGTPDFTIFLNALLRMQRMVIRHRDMQESAAKRLMGPIVEDTEKSKRKLVSWNPNLTQSYAKRADRLRLV